MYFILAGDYDPSDYEESVESSMGSPQAIDSGGIVTKTVFATVPSSLSSASGEVREALFHTFTVSSARWISGT